jgi:hypothetical protein
MVERPQTSNPARGPFRLAGVYDFDFDVGIDGQDDPRPTIFNAFEILGLRIAKPRR